MVRLPWRSGVGVVCVLQGRCPGWWTGPGGAVGHPFAARGRHEALRQGSRWAGSIRGATTPTVGGHDCTTRAHREVRAGSCRHRCRCVAGSGRGGRAARRRRTRSARGRRRRRRCCGRGGRRPGRGRCPRRVCAGTRCTDSIAAQRTSREPCLVIRPRCTVVSDSWCFGVSPAHRPAAAGRGSG